MAKKKIRSRQKKKPSNCGYKPVDHTADIGLYIWGVNMESLLTAGFKGLIGITSALKNLNGNESIKLKISSDDRESLLISFLNEILYLINVKRWMPAKIVKLKISGKILTAELSGAPYKSPAALRTEVKAATYHAVEIKDNDDILSTNVYFDL